MTDAMQAPTPRIDAQGASKIALSRARQRDDRQHESGSSCDKRRCREGLRLVGAEGLGVRDFVDVDLGSLANHPSTQLREIRNLDLAVLPAHQV